MNPNCPKGGRHEIDWDQDSEWACAKCAQYVPLSDVMALANAAMQLTAEEAQQSLNNIEDNDETGPLADYIKAWPK